LGGCLLWAFLKITEPAQILGYIYHSENNELNCAKTGWATFLGSFFSFTNLVALLPTLVT
jgi:hypothetical protein